MAEYQAPLADMKFVLRELVDMNLLAQLNSSTIPNELNFISLKSTRGCKLNTPSPKLSPVLI